MLPRASLIAHILTIKFRTDLIARLALISHPQGIILRSLLRIQLCFLPAFIAYHPFARDGFRTVDTVVVDLLHIACICLAIVWAFNNLVSFDPWLPPTRGQIYPVLCESLRELLQVLTTKVEDPIASSPPSSAPSSLADELSEALQSIGSESTSWEDRSDHGTEASENTLEWVELLSESDIRVIIGDVPDIDEGVSVE